MNINESYKKIVKNIETVMKGQSNAIRMLLAGFISGGHVLLSYKILWVIYLFYKRIILYPKLSSGFWPTYYEERLIVCITSNARIERSEISYPPFFH